MRPLASFEERLALQGAICKKKAFLGSLENQKSNIYRHNIITTCLLDISLLLF
jgi:hypothetical protein